MTVVWIFIAATLAAMGLAYLFTSPVLTVVACCAAVMAAFCLVSDSAGWRQR